MQNENIKTPFTLSQFYQMVIRREGDDAEIIVDDNNGQPIRLIGFKTSSQKDDLDILEEGYDYYLNLIGKVKDVINSNIIASPKEIFTRKEIEKLQSEVFEITGEGSVMGLFNKLLGVSEII